MNTLRITMNFALSGVLVAAGLYVLFTESCVMRDMRFIGWSRYLLSASLLSMAGFPAVVASGWIRGSLSRPPPSRFTWHPTYVDPVYKGTLLVRHWYIVMPALTCFGLALALAEKAPETARHIAAILPAFPCQLTNRRAELHSVELQQKGMAAKSGQRALGRNSFRWPPMPAVADELP